MINVETILNLGTRQYRDEYGNRASIIECKDGVTLILMPYARSISFAFPNTEFAEKALERYTGTNWRKVDTENV